MRHYQFIPWPGFDLSKALRKSQQRSMCKVNWGSFKYYVIKILTLLEPTHPVCNQTLLTKSIDSMLVHTHLAYHTHPLDYLIFQRPFDKISQDGNIICWFKAWVGLFLIIAWYQVIIVISQPLINLSKKYDVNSKFISKY